MQCNAMQQHHARPSEPLRGSAAGQQRARPANQSEPNGPNSTASVDQLSDVWLDGPLFAEIVQHSLATCKEMERLTDEWYGDAREKLSNRRRKRPSSAMRCAGYPNARASGVRTCVCTLMSAAYSSALNMSGFSSWNKRRSWTTTNTRSRSHEPTTAQQGEESATGRENAPWQVSGLVADASTSPRCMSLVCGRPPACS